MSGGVPANTTTTTTVNQSPWQNPTYQALMLGTKDNPGPITNILRSNAGYMNAYNTMLGKGITPMDVVNSGRYNPTAGTAGTSFQEAAPQAAAEGGIMNARGYAKGGLSTDAANFLADKLASGKKISPAYQKQLDAYIKANPESHAAQAQTTQKQEADRTAQAQQRILEQSMGQTAFTRINPQTGQLESTNPLFNQAVNRVMDAQRMPEQFGQATSAYNQAISGLQGMTNYTPEQIAARRAEAYGYDPNTVLGGTGYAAMQMNAPRDIKAQGYTAEEAQAAQMLQPEDVQGQTYQAANIAPTQRETAQQIGDIGTITGQGYSAAQMAPTRKERASTTAAPKSWTDLGVAQQYMNPYAQAVINQNVQEANRNFQKNLSALRGQAAKSKAYGGSRQGLEEAEALRNQGYLLADIQDKGLSQAYTQGMGQFQAEQQLGSQVGMSNTAQINQLKSQYMQMGMTEAQANQAAINQAAQFSATQGQAAQTQNVANQLAAQQANAQMVNQLKSQYMQMGLTEAQANQAAQNQAAQFGAQSAQQAALANQQAGLTTGQANLSAEQQTALANQQAINQQRSQYVTQALQAATTSYGGQLTAAQQNQIAANAAAQYNSQNQQQINMVDQAARNAALQFYATAQNTASQQYAQNQLAAAQANQQAGLQANQQNLGAYGQMLQGAQGLGSLGGLYGQTNLANIGALGQAASAWQNLGQQYLNTQQGNALNAINFPSSLYSGALNAINAQPSTGGTTTATGTSSPASWMGRAEGGEVEAHKEWDKAKGGKTAKTGIASKGWN